jgi:hypothetical protein
LLLRDAALADERLSRVMADWFPAMAAWIVGHSGAKSVRHVCRLFPQRQAVFAAWPTWPTYWQPIIAGLTFFVAIGPSADSLQIRTVRR